MGSNKVVKRILIISGILIAVSILLNVYMMFGAKKKPTVQAPPPSKELTELTKDFSYYNNSKLGFTIKYPKDWEVREDIPDIAVAFFAPTGGSKDSFQDNINISVQKVTSRSITLDAYKDLSIEGLSTTISDYKQISLGKSFLAQSPSYKLSYTGSLQQYGNLQWLQEFTIKNKNLYVVTFAAKAEKYEGLSKTAQAIISTLEVK